MRNVLLTIVIVLAITASLTAQDTPVGVTFYASAGLSMPISPEYLTNWWESGMNFGGGVGYDLSRYITMQGFFTANSFGFNNSKFEDLVGAPSDFSISGGAIKTTTITANVKASFIAHGNKVVPYFVGGLGYFHISADSLTYGSGSISYTIPMFDESKSTLSSCLGFGVDIMVLEQAGIFIECTPTVGAVEIKNVGNLPDADEGIVAYVPFRFGVFYQL